LRAHVSAYVPEAIRCEIEVDLPSPRESIHV
jgi:hypothetical protein